MSDPTLVVLFSSMPGILAGVAAIFGIWNNILAKRSVETAKLNSKHIEETKSSISVLEKNTNGIKDALVEATRRMASAEGMAQGTAAGVVEGKRQAAETAAAISSVTSHKNE